MFRTAILSVLSGLMFATTASPCGFHNYVPQPSLTDRLLGSEDIVLARSTPEALFEFASIKPLEGALGQIEIPYLVDSPTRRKFAADPTATVLFARDDAYGPWRRLALVDTTIAPVLAEIMTRLPAWEAGDYLDRFKYFATLVGHDDLRLHKLALLELDQADYPTLRGLDLDIIPSQLLARIDAPDVADLKAIRILLLGLSGSDEIRKYLESAVKESITSESQYLGAYATALIELEGPKAVRDITSGYLVNTSLSLLTRESLVEAIALHGQNGEEEMEATIPEAIGSALWVAPDLAGSVARQFGVRSDWSHLSSLQSLQNEGLVYLAADDLDVSDYLKFALQAKAKP